MSVSKSSLSSAAPIRVAFSDLFEIDESSQTLMIHLGLRNDLSDALFVRCREEIARLADQGDIEEIVFDLAGILVLPSSALGLIAAVSQGAAKVRVVNASQPAREDFQLTGLYRMIELEPAPQPPRK